MALKTYKPVTPSRRFMVTVDNTDLSKVKPEKSLLEPIKKNDGRNCYDRITVSHRGRGHKRKYRIIDVKRHKIGTPAKVASNEYEPKRSARIGLLVYAEGE